VAAEPFDLLEAGRMAAIADPAGAVFCVWEPNSHKGAEAVNTAGT
jgi:predicted enzyme related to lactoylglutathione lyase